MAIIRVAVALITFMHMYISGIEYSLPSLDASCGFEVSLARELGIVAVKSTEETQGAEYRAIKILKAILKQLWTAVGVH